MERTFVALKPDAVQRGLIGEIITRFEKKGFKIVGLKMMHVTKERAEKHYEEHVNKPFYPRLVEYITGGPIVAMALEGVKAISAARKLMGCTDPQEAEQGSIRADYCQVKEFNIIHGSDSAESAKRELALYFDEDEIDLDWKRETEPWINL